MTTKGTKSSAATLVAIVVAARHAGDRDLERQARRQLEDSHAVKLTFVGRAREEETGNGN